IMDTHLSGSLATETGTVARSGEQLAQGDLILNPFLLGWHRKNFYWNFTTAFFLPVGKYDVDKVINSGKNYVTIDPELGFTYFNPMHGIDVSLAVGYSINFENQATQYESGDAIHVDFAAEKIFRFGLKAGAVGYAWVQVNGDSGAGAILGPFKGRVFGAGPALGYNFKIGKRTLGTMFKYYREFGAKNHFQGNAFDLALTFDI
ncbi:MAG TPA: transporter, partial [bacterium]|nr:transporter [bacterium]